MWVKCVIKKKKAFYISQVSITQNLPNITLKNIQLNKVPLGERIRDKISNHLIHFSKAF